MSPGPTSEDGSTTDAEPMEDATGSVRGAHIDPSLSGVFDALSSARSRRVLYALSEAPSGRLAFDDLVETIGANETGGDATGDAVLEEIRSTLHHAHLPKLADLELIAPDWEEGTITLTEERERFEPYLSLSRQIDDSR